MYLRRRDGRIEVVAPAKLNLFLEVLARRDDGYHELETVMVAISIYDTLVLAARDDEQIHLTCHVGSRADDGGGPRGGGSAPGLRGKGVPSGPDNLVWQAVERLRQRAGVSRGASIELIKRIPWAAGLGGGSSDAAAALAAANAAWRLGWPPAWLAAVAAEVGSDAPFFVVTGQLGAGAAVCRGRGEQVAPVAAAGPLHVVVAAPREGLATADVFAACQPPDRSESAAPVLDALRRGDPALVARRLKNRLEEPARRLAPAVARTLQELARLDCLGQGMSGSGSSCFGICRSARHARRLAAALRARNVGRVCAARTLTGRCGGPSLG